MRRFFFPFLLLLFCLPCFSFAQYYSGTGYYNDMANYSYFWNHASSAQKTMFGIDQFFGALNQSVHFHNRTQAAEKSVRQGRNQLENYKSLKRYATEGTPPFASHGPDGRPRSKKITWEDVHSIDGSGFGDNP